MKNKQIDKKQEAKITPQDKKKADIKEYGAKQITVLEGLEPVRKRPAMYIGSTDLAGLHHLIWEVADNALDEATGGYCNEISIELLEGNKVRVSDNGRGIPVDIHKGTGKSALEVVMTKLHAGGKFDQGAYKISGGLHGVGVSVVNALSVYTKAEVKRDGKLWAQEYKRGIPTGKVKPTGKAEGSGTIITFQPDPEIFPKTDFNFETILNHLRQQAYLTRGIKISVSDESSPKNKKSYTFYFEGGVYSFVQYLNRTNEPLHPNVFYVAKEAEDIFVEVGFQYTNDFRECLLGFANNIYTPEGGSHVVGFRSALTRVLNSYARDKEYIKEKDANLSGDDVREGLTTVISVKLKDPQFEGQTKSKLGNVEARTAVDTIFSTAFKDFLEEHPKDAEAIIKRCVLSAKARQAAKSARETILRKGVLESLALPGKLADCTSRDPQLSELFIVEGDSAGGSCKMARDRMYQAILPLRGKIMNVERARLDKILSNQELKSLVIALGTNIGEQFEIEKLRYHKIIIMTDADVDGSHIRTLLLTFFYRYFPELVNQGFIYAAQPPLYRVQFGGNSKYFYNEEDKDKFLKQERGDKSQEVGKACLPDRQGFKVKKIGDSPKQSAPKNFNIQRYKGLGEMNPDELFETTMNKNTRILKKIEVENASKTDEIFDILMGKDVEPRKRFIQTHAKAVKNLDI